MIFIKYAPFHEDYQYYDFLKRFTPPLFCYPISVIHNDWSPSEEFREMKNNIQKIFPHEIAESEEKDFIVESLPEKRIYGNRF